MDGGGGGAPPALEKNAAELTVMDVYDIASAVGQEFERVIDQHGCEAIARLMPKVVRVLEILEVLVSRNHINPEMEELRLELDRLRLERMDRIEKERKHQKVRAGSGGRRRGRAVSACRSPARGEPGPWLSASPSPPPQPLGKTKRAAEGAEQRKAGGRDTSGYGQGRLTGAAWMQLSLGEGLGVLLLGGDFSLPSWKFPSSSSFSTPSPITAFPSPCVSSLRTLAPSHLLRSRQCCFLLGQEKSLIVIHFSLRSWE